MAEEKKEEAAGEEGAAPPKKKIKLDSSLILSILNILAVLGAVGTAVYTKLIFKKSKITESSEMENIHKVVKKGNTDETKREMVTFENMTLNLMTSSSENAHFATITFSIECESPEAAANVSALKAILNDLVVKAFAKKQVADLNTIQGRLVLKTELLREFNKVVAEYTKNQSPTSIHDMFFSQFILQ